MNRRGFIQGLIAAPTVITSAGVFGTIIRPPPLVGVFADGSPWIVAPPGGVSFSVNLLPQIAIEIQQMGIDAAGYSSKFDLEITHDKAGRAHLSILDRGGGRLT